MSCETCKSKLSAEDIERLEKDAKERRKSDKIRIVCTSIIAVCTVLMIGILGVLAAGVEITTTTETQTVEGDTATINNGEYEQYNDNAINTGGDG